MSRSTEELQQQIRAIIKSPMKSTISTADIAVGMMSSTGLSEKVIELSQLFDQELAKRVEEAEKLVFIDIPTGHEISQISLVHEPKCSHAQSKGFMCDCSVLKAAQFAVDKAKIRIYRERTTLNNQRREEVSL